jgi:hypothetical protein
MANRLAISAPKKSDRLVGPIRRQARSFKTPNLFSSVLSPKFDESDRLQVVIPPKACRGGFETRPIWIPLRRCATLIIAISGSAQSS